MTPDASHFAQLGQWVQHRPPDERARILLAAVLMALESFPDEMDKRSTDAVLALRLTRLRPEALQACEDGVGFEVLALTQLLRVTRRRPMAQR